MAQEVATVYGIRSEVLTGGLLSDGTISATALGLTTDEGAELMLGGKIMAALTDLADVDVFATAGDVGQAIYDDGSDASVIDLTAASGNTAYVTMIAVNSDGAGAADEDDGGAALYLAVVKGVAADFETQTEHLTSVEIQAALEASTGVHDETTAWVHLAQVLWDEGSSSPVATVTLNRNNHLGV